MTNALTITQPTVMLPMILNGSSGHETSMLQADGADWLTLGYGPAHTSHHLTDSGGANFALVWSRPLQTFPKPMEQIAIADGIVVAASNSDSQAIIVGLDAYTGQELWQLSFDSQHINGQYTVSPPTIANGFAYFSVKEFSADSSLYSLDLYSGKQIWQLKYWNYASEILAPIVVGDKIYIGGLSALHIAGAAGGEPYWYVTISYSAVNNKWTPSYANNKIYLWVRGNFYENDPESGKVLWNLVDVDSEIGDLDEDTAPVISGKIALVVSMVKLAAIDLSTHEIAWSAAGNYDQTIPAVADDVVYAIGNGELEARRLTDGALLWSFAGDSALTNAPIVAGNYVYVASNNNTYVLNRNTHQLVWTTAHGGWLSLANGYLYIAQPDNTIYAYRAESE
jgi:outer membrane protein assembly factor BamB